MSETKACPELAEAKAEIVYQAKLLIKLRRKIALFVHDMEDEGDRVYFGSTNDADDLRALYREFDEFEWSRMEKNRKGRDLFAELRSIRKKARELAEDRDRASDACATVQRERDALREALQNIADGNIGRKTACYWRRDKKPSRLDRCPHDKTMSDECGECVEEYVYSVIGSQS